MGHGADLLPGTVADGFSGLLLFPTCLLTFFLRDDWLAGMAAFPGVVTAAASLNRDDASRFVCGGPRLATVCGGNARGGRLRDAVRPVAAAPGFLFWANGHGGYVMGWAIAGVYWD